MYASIVPGGRHSAERQKQRVLAVKRDTIEGNVLRAAYYEVHGFERLIVPNLWLQWGRLRSWVTLDGEEEDEIITIDAPCRLTKL